MAASRHLPSSALLIVLVVALTTIPGLFLFQGMVRHARQGRERLVADLVVRMDGRPPHHLTVQLLERPGAQGAASARIQLVGRERMRGGSFPWREVPLEALLELDLPRERLFAGGTPMDLATTEGDLTARYQERSLGTPEGGSTSIPCIGGLKISGLGFGGDAPAASWARVRRFEGTLELHCDASGDDQRDGTADDLHFTLLGTLDYHWERPQ
ncbi:MAG: hypothetical protein ABIO70_12015 [Pseudomonadota bacterium]